MKAKYLLLNVLTVFMATLVNAYGANETSIYNSGLLVVVFLGFCALVVIAQLIPAFLVLTGMIKGLVKGTKEKHVEVEAGK
ncbi:MAG: hypothetical protein WA133_13865 [Syntrophales bacterium]